MVFGARLDCGIRRQQSYDYCSALALTAQLSLLTAQLSLHLQRCYELQLMR